MEAGQGEITEVAVWLLENLNFSIVLFEGEMGSGKTTLIKALARELGIEDQVASPTFSLVNEYLYKGDPVFHFDFYRIDDPEEAMDMGLDEYLHSGHLCWIEWPEKIRNLIPGECSTVKIGFAGDTRTYEIIQPTK